MIQGLIAGTLAALNSVVAPFGGKHDDVANTFRFALQNPPAAATVCMTRGQDPSVKVKLEPAGEFSVRVKMESRLCNDKQKLSLQKTNFVLPMDVFDNAFLATLVEERPYILQDVVDPSHPQSRSRLKVTRLKDSLFSKLATDKLAPGANAHATVSVSMQAFMIEWVPISAAALPEHPPLTVWMKASGSSENATGNTNDKRLASRADRQAGDHQSPRQPSSLTDASPSHSMNASNAPLLTFPWERFAYTMKNNELIGQLSGAEVRPKKR